MGFDFFVNFVFLKTSFKFFSKFLCENFVGFFSQMFSIFFSKFSSELLENCFSIVFKNRTLPKNYETETWQMLEEAVRAIQNRSSFIRFSLEKLNQTVANLVDGNAEIALKTHQVYFV